MLCFFSHNFDVEGFNSLGLSYLTKRSSGGYDSVEARAMLAAIDYNAHLHRPYLKAADGSVQLQRRYNKRSRRECVGGVKMRKRFWYERHMHYMAMEFFSNGSCIPDFAKAVSFNPKSIAPTIRGTPSLPTPSLAKRQMTRLKKL